MDNPLNGAKQAMMQRMASQVTPSDMPLTQTLANTWAGLERNQQMAAMRLSDAAGLDVDGQPVPVDQRRAQLLDLADALTNQRFQAWWWETIGPEFVENADRARQYASLDSDEWHETIRDWHHQHYRNGTVSTAVEDATPADLCETASRHVEAVFGVSLRKFVALVVNWDQGYRLREVLAGHFERHTALMNQVADGLENDT